MFTANIIIRTNNVVLFLPPSHLRRDALDIIYEEEEEELLRRILEKLIYSLLFSL